MRKKKEVKSLMKLPTMTTATTTSASTAFDEEKAVLYIQSLLDTSDEEEIQGRSLSECFAHASDAAAYMRLFRQHAALKYSFHYPEIMDKAVELARGGNMEAIKLITTIIGLTDKAASQLTVATQINLSSEERKRLEADFSDVKRNE
jgi:hypothetical protein